jgi:hypothetical protein
MGQTKGRHSYPKEAEAPGRLSRLLQLVAVAAIVTLVSASLAVADEVRNDVVAGGNDTITAGGSTTINYRVKNLNNNAGDTQNNCNPADGSPVTITLSVPANVTASTTQVTLSGCEPQSQPVTFSSSVAGNYAITCPTSPIQGWAPTRTWPISRCTSTPRLRRPTRLLRAFLPM